MAASAGTTRAIVAVLLDELGLERARRIVTRLAGLPGNHSYRQTMLAVQRVLEDAK